jgi:hypothetical protein
MNNASALATLVSGIYRTRANRNLPAFVGVAPLVSNANLKGQYVAQRVTGSSGAGRFDARNGTGQSSISADFRMGQIDFVRQEFSLKNWKSDEYKLPFQLTLGNPQIAQLDALVGVAMDEVYGAAVNHFMAVAANDLPNETTLVLTSNNAGLTEAVDSYIRTIQLACGFRPNAIHVGYKTAQRLLRQDDVVDGVAISGFVTSGSTVRRLGSSAPERLAAYFRDIHGLELYVEDRNGIDTTGVPGYLADAGMIITHTQGGDLNSAFKCYHQGVDLLTMLSATDKYGRATFVAAEGDFVVHTTDDAAGVFVPVTLPA